MWVDAVTLTDGIVLSSVESSVQECVLEFEGSLFKSFEKCFVFSCVYEKLSKEVQWLLVVYEFDENRFGSKNCFKNCRFRESFRNKIDRSALASCVRNRCTDQSFDVRRSFVSKMGAVTVEDGCRDYH